MKGYSKIFGELSTIKEFKKKEIIIEQGTIENWQYALPIDMKKQLSYFGQNSEEENELFEVLKEMIDFVNMPEIHWEE